MYFENKDIKECQIKFLACDECYQLYKINIKVFIV